MVRLTVLSGSVSSQPPISLNQIRAHTLLSSWLVSSTAAHSSPLKELVYNVFSALRTLLFPSFIDKYSRKQIFTLARRVALPGTHLPLAPSLGYSYKLHVYMFLVKILYNDT